ncbi:phospho-N-acetylmuramoyl-pentapeptide-transferase [Geochorda subterranea]|uniref:Phospho-N-acetylmuramoyl-pentapeptide-transferase n=1 Tax=Geochorda subterranea TaxID=3109564 RepID=A0ABZ1BSS4_9FIRM|nr:phospho-N-acetylmuramoyl-pentapeptide-transferase [Limnochorda sp. LNt]WRP15834.1 phospho-N-acetylmuramoyl-pentapeptide-transferase [Limnochorda sp. LNt]
MTGIGGALAAALLSTLVTLALLPGTIRMLRQLGAGKSIRAEGPARHAAKAGTPTMGGVVMVGASAAATLALAPDLDVALPLVAGVAAFGLLGSLDDLRALVRRRAMGLRAREKLAGQLLLGAALGAWALRVAPEVSQLSLPFTQARWDLAPLPFVLLAAVATAGATNAVNLTDGLDGLAAGAVALTSAVYAGAALLMDRPSVAIFAASVAGACLGFIWYNGYPAQVFMGDAGSLALGAALMGMAIFTQTLLVLPIVGGLFVAETLSVMAQVTYFRLTGGRRLLRMSPLHHHLELSGWSEPKVVVRLWLAAALCGLLGLWAMLPGLRG